MTYAPSKLIELRSFLAGVTGLSPVALGIVGDAAHALAGTSYHLGRDQLITGTYSAATARDRAGLTNAASAIDIGSFPRLRDLSVWLVEQCRANTPDTRDFREIIFSPDGTLVLRWDRERGVASLPRPGEASLSHRDHTHASWYRDAEYRDHSAVFRRYFGGSIDMLGIVTRTPFPYPVLFVTRIGTTLIGYDPARPNVAVVSRAWTAASPAHARASVYVSWPGDTSPPVPRGGPFLEVIDGIYAGLIIVAGLVTWAPPTPVDVSTARQEGYTIGRTAVLSRATLTPAALEDA